MEIREIMLLIDISPPGRDKLTFVQMLYDPATSFGRKLKKIQRLYALLSLFSSDGML